MKSYKVSLGSLGLLVLLSACGGGGGGGDGQSQPTVTELPPATITAANAQRVAAAAVGSVESREAAAAAAQSSSDTGPQGGGTIFPFTNRVAMSVAEMGERRLPALTNTKVVSCSGSGSVTGFVNDADDSQNLSKDDSVDLTFDRCVDSESGSTINGAVKTRVTEGSPVLTPVGRNITLDMTFTNLSVTENQAGGSETTTINGNLTFRLLSSGTTATQATLTTNGLTIADPNDRLTLTNFSLTVGEDTAAGYTISGSGTVSSQQLNGSVKINISANLVGTGSNPPDSGSIQITAKDSSLLVTAIGSGDVTIDVDSNNDGTFEAPRLQVAWESL